MRAGVVEFMPFAFATVGAQCRRFHEVRARAPCLDVAVSDAACMLEIAPMPSVSRLQPASSSGCAACTSKFRPEDPNPRILWRRWRSATCTPRPSPSWSSSSCTRARSRASGARARRRSTGGGARARRGLPRGSAGGCTRRAPAVLARRRRPPVRAPRAAAGWATASPSCTRRRARSTCSWRTRARWRSTWSRRSRAPTCLRSRCARGLTARAGRPRFRARGS